MPTLNIQTNVPADGVVTSDILRDASKIICRVLGKPEGYVMVSLNAGIPMCFAGSEEPTAFGHLISVGALGPDPNKKLSAALAELIDSKLGVPSNRFYIKFDDVKRSDLGWSGSTLHDLLGPSPK
eukprot:jgi/Mesen1/8043/ME000043S07431